MYDLLAIGVPAVLVVVIAYKVGEMRGYMKGHEDGGLEAKGLPAKYAPRDR
jgi:hypothetical protein